MHDVEFQGPVVTHGTKLAKRRLVDEFDSLAWESGGGTIHEGNTSGGFNVAVLQRKGLVDANPDELRRIAQGGNSLTASLPSLSGLASGAGLAVLAAIAFAITLLFAGGGE